MSFFSIIPPSPILAPYIKNYIVLKKNDSFYDAQRVLPTGCVELMIYQRGSTKTVIDSSSIPQYFISGTTNSYLDLIPNGGEVHYISILFQPYGAKAFFHIPINEFHNRLIPVEDINDRSWSDLCYRLTETINVTTCIQLIEQFLIKKLNDSKLYHLKRVISTINKINLYSKMEVAALAKEACLTEKQFKRIFNAYVGCNPKKFIRISRFNKALNILKQRRTADFIQIAYDCGYSDQSHFIREFKSFSGYTPLNILTPDTGFHYF